MDLNQCPTTSRNDSTRNDMISMVSCRFQRCLELRSTGSPVPSPCGQHEIMSGDPGLYLSLRGSSVAMRSHWQRSLVAFTRLVSTSIFCFHSPHSNLPNHRKSIISPSCIIKVSCLVAHWPHQNRGTLSLVAVLDLLHSTRSLSYVFA